jgi:hypothetical protein
MADVVSSGGSPVDSGLVTAWIKALGGTSVDHLQRRLSWDAASINNISSYMTSLLGSQQFPEIGFIQAWLKESGPIDTEQRDLNCQNVPFVDLWLRIALGAMESLTGSLPEHVANAYQVKESLWGQYKDLRADLIGTLTARLSTIGQPAMWEEFNKRRTADQVIFAYLDQAANAQAPPGEATILRSLRNCAVTV